MNYMKQVAEMLGVELNQEFRVKGFKNIYKFTDKGLVEVTFNSDNVNYIIKNVLYFLLDGQWKIEKLILDKEEKEYLENFLRPFKDRVVYIRKTDGVTTGGEWIVIFVDDNIISLPRFREGTMYKGMKLDRQYTLKELGLFEDE